MQSQNLEDLSSKIKKYKIDEWEESKDNVLSII